MLSYLLYIGTSIYLADFISGIVHLYLDYKEIQDASLRLHSEDTMLKIQHFQATSTVFKSASKNDQFLWNFHSHHDVPYPSCDSKTELFLQILRPLSLPMIIVIILLKKSMVSSEVGGVLLMSFILGSLTQFTHFLAHARSRGLVKSSALKLMQDYHIILHPDTHRVHHTEFDCNFCIFNGWANPLVNRIRSLGSMIRVFPHEAPTVTVRRDRLLASIEKTKKCE